MTSYVRNFFSMFLVGRIRGAPTPTRNVTYYDNDAAPPNATKGPFPLLWLPGLR